jgi:hypothetical protein
MMGFPAGWTDELGRNAALRCLGNAVVPQCAEVIGRWLHQLANVDHLESPTGCGMCDDQPGGCRYCREARTEDITITGGVL